MGLDLVVRVGAVLKMVGQRSTGVSQDSGDGIFQSLGHHHQYLFMIQNLEIGGQVFGQLSNTVATGVPDSGVLMLDELLDAVHNGGNLFRLVAHVLSDLGERHDAGMHLLPVLGGKQLLNNRRESWQNNNRPNMRQ